jgi:hypothetical protein
VIFSSNVNWSLHVVVKSSYAGAINLPALSYIPHNDLYTTLGLALHPLAHKHPLNTTPNLGAKSVGTLVGVV